MKLQNTSSESAWNTITSVDGLHVNMWLKSVRFNSDAGQNNMFSSTIHPILFNTPIEVKLTVEGDEAERDYFSGDLLTHQLLSVQSTWT